MDIEQITIKIFADANQAIREYERVNKAFYDTTLRMERQGRRAGIPKEQISRDVDAVIREYERMRAAHERTLARIRARSIWEAANAGSSRGATATEVAGVKKLLSAGAVIHIPGVTPGAERAATAKETEAIRQLLNAGQRGYAPGEREAMRLRNMNQMRPGVFGREFDRDRFGGRGGGRGGGGGFPGDDEPGASPWDWKSSIIAGAFGRLFGGRLGGMGGLIGGGLGGPIGGIAGAGAGALLEVGFKGAEMAIHGVVAGAQALAHWTLMGAEAAVKYGIEFERMRTTYEVLIGKDKGGKLFQDIQQLGINTPYTTRQLAGQGQTLLGYGASPDAVIPALARLGDIAGGDEERLQRLSLAFGQVLSHGRLMGQELRQFAEVGVGLEDFAKTAKMSGFEFKAAMERGEVSAEVMIQTINRLTSVGGRFFGLSQEQMKKVGGAWSNVVERVQLGAATLGQSVFDKFDVAGKLNKFSEVIGGWGDQIKPFVEWLERASKAVEPLEDAFTVMKGTVTDVFSSIYDGAPAFDSLTNSVKEFGIEFNAIFAMSAEVIKNLPSIFEGALSEMNQAAITLAPVPAVAHRLGQGVSEDTWRTLFPLVAAAGGPFGILGGIGGGQGSDLATEIERAHRIFRDDARRKTEKARTDRISRALWRTMMPIMFPSTATGQPIPDMFGLSPQAEKFGIGIREKMLHGGLSHQDAFEYQNRLAGEAARGLVGKFPAVGRSQRAFEEMGQGGGIFAAGFRAAGIAASQMGVALTPGQKAFADFENFQKLAGTVQDRLHAVDRLAPVMMKGSSEAQDIVNKSGMRQQTTQERVERILFEANRQREEQKVLQKETLEALKELKGVDVIFGDM